MRILFAVIGAFVFLAVQLPAAAQNKGYYRTPALHENTLVFSSEGDLWRVDANGGTALRLTSHPEVESEPAISPDGRKIAFLASYDGPREVYVMPITGGIPTRLTHEGGGVNVRGWMDNSRILYRSTNIPGTTPRQLRTIHYQTRSVADMPFADADMATFDGNNHRLFFTRFGLSTFSDNAVLYRGGRMAQLWSAGLNRDEEAIRLSSGFGAPIRRPMYWSERIYFVSDKSGADNIWSVDTSGGDPRQHTARDKWQIKSPYLFGGKIIFQSGADLFKFDIQTQSTSPIEIQLMSDGDYQRRRWLKAPLDYLETARLSAQGDALAVTARGRIASAFLGKRRRVDHQIPPGVRARSAAYRADGEAIYVILDDNEFGEIWQIPSSGYGERKQLTTESNSYIWGLRPSPHDQTLLYTDKRGHLYLLDPDAGTSTLIDVTKSGNDLAFQDITWSSGGRYITYTFYDRRDMPQVAIYDTQLKKKTVVTTGKYESFAPAFAADTSWLYFISNRNFEASPGAPWGDRNMGPAFSSRGQLYAVQLRPDAEFPFEPRNELFEAADDKNDGEDDSKDEKSDENSSEGEQDITTVGLSARLWTVPVAPGDFTALAANENHIFVLSTGARRILKRLKITSEKPKLNDFASGVDGFELSADGSKLFVQTKNGNGTKFLILGANKDFPSDISTNAVRLSDWTLAIDPKDEWRQMILDAWRLHRDFAYDPNLRGVDWDAVRDHYAPLADRLGHRSEADDLLSQMSAELGILHSQIRPGDVPIDTESGKPSFLGATYIEREDGLEIASIYSGETDRPHTLGPLLKPGNDVAAGDVISAIDGVKVRSRADLANQLTTKAGQEILLEFTRSRDTPKKVIREIIVPVSGRQEASLRYGHWVQGNRETVASQSEDEIGYIHLRAMGSRDAASFARDFYEHHDKQGLIIDVRGNRGGNIDSWIIGTLLRRAWAFWQNPHGGPPTKNMQQTFRGHLVILINEGTYSDGETFAAGVKALNIAPLIGTRTAGAGIWLSDRNPLVDGGQARVAEFPQYGEDGRWLIEGRGISPDIIVNNPPRSTYLGVDKQLNRALSYLDEKIANEPVPTLTARPLPHLGINGEDVD